MKTLSMLLVLLAGPGDDVLQPWGSNKHPSDVPKKHAQDLNQNKQTYTVVQGGTMDGQNCRTPLGVGMSREGAIEQTWESNRAVRMENVGDADVVNPWLSDGVNLRTFDEVVAASITPGMTDAEKATAVWHQFIKHRYHYGGADGSEEGDLIKVLHIYGYNTCGSDSMIMGGLWKQLGLKAAPARGVGHCISQVFYDGKWHLFDGDMKTVYLNRDNETVAGEQDIVRDHDLIKRSHNQGILQPQNRGGQEWMAGIYGFEGEVKGARDCYRDGSLKMTLRPGEALVWRWGHLTPVKHHSNNPALYADTICNGLWEYRPDFSKETWKKGAVVEGVKSTPAGLTEGTITWTMKSPYVMVGGRLDAEGEGAVFSISWDGKTWAPVGDFDKQFAMSNGGKARYGYQLRCTLSGAATLKRLAIVNDLQMAPLSLPEMAVGKNTFTYTDESTSRKVRITHDWVERSASKPPSAPAAVYPPDKGEAAGTDIVFKWSAPTDSDGDKIVDYQFELSNRADLRWPLSMTFQRMISKTADKGKEQFTLPEAGLLTGDRKYHWRVRAKDAKGVWGPWSAIWSFTAKAPNYPVDVAIEGGVLRWKPNPTGKKPALYRVYGSDEKGFSISDQPYTVAVGNNQELKNPFPANFVAETKAAELPVSGFTYYRVVAVDDSGKRSGPSDYVVAPRPTIHSKPVATAKAGAPYQYAVRANRSLGHLTLRQGNVASFWDVEKLTFAMAKGPEWLKIDAATGVLSGTPPGPGTFEVEVTAALDREVRKVDGDVLAWGNEKVLSTAVERVGTAQQKFTITVEK